MGPIATATKGVLDISVGHQTKEALRAEVESCPMHKIESLLQGEYRQPYCLCPTRDIALVVTSCRRFDLLERTIDSMRPWVADFEQKIIVEDSGEHHALLSRLKQEGFRIVVNGRQIGQHASVDKAYTEVTKPYIFHSEDDWLFSRKPDLISGIQILDRGKERISCVCFYDATDDELRNQKTFSEFTINDSRYRYSPKQNTVFNSFTFTPSLIRKDLWQRHGPWRKFISEDSIASFIKRAGYTVITERPGVVTHIGQNRHVFDRRRHRTRMKSIWQWLRKGV